MAEYWNAPRSGVKAYSEEPSDGDPNAITAYFDTGAYTYTRQSVGDANFENMLNLAHDGIGLCRYITANCKMNYASKVSGAIKPKGGTTQQTSARLKGYWNGSRISHGSSYNLDNKGLRLTSATPELASSRDAEVRPDNRTKHSHALANELSSNPLPSGVTKTKRGASNSNELVNYWANSHASTASPKDIKHEPLSSLPSGVGRNKRGSTNHQAAKPRIKLKSHHVASASKSNTTHPKPRIKLKTRK